MRYKVCRTQDRFNVQFADRTEFALGAQDQAAELTLEGPFFAECHAASLGECTELAHVGSVQVAGPRVIKSTHLILLTKMLAHR